MDKSPLFGGRLAHLFWTRVLGFPQRITLDDVVYGQKRVSSIDFAAARVDGRALASARLPTFVSYARDDPLFEAAVFEEVERELGRMWWGSGKRVRSYEENGAWGFVSLPFDTGGHNVQKTRAAEICAAIEAWVRHCEGAAAGYA